MSGENRTPTNTHELLELLKLASPLQPSQVDTSKLRYVIYARKSTTGDERQERSIPDQIKDCVDKVARQENLSIVGDPIEEKCSAKDPDIRPKFKKLLEDVRSGKVDGIISWHPDRLSRNMKEAGEIIDLLDKGVLKDLRFATSTFENSPTGKMLLGISFVLSKQYSEHLSGSVTRGNRRKTEDGIFFDEMKHGYYISDGRLYPDGPNFGLIQEAFQKRIGGMAQKDIGEWLNEQGYQVRKKGKEPILYTWNKSRISKLFKDPVYAGVLKYGSHLAVLSEYYELTPAISVEDFFKINKIKDFESGQLVSSMNANKREHTKANLLRRVVWCGYCDKPFSSGLTPKMLKSGRVYYYFYKCETEGCEFQGRSVRAKQVLDYAYKFLDKNLFTTKSNYEAFVKEAEGYAQKYSQDLAKNIMSVTKQIGIKQREYDDAKNFLVKNEHLKSHYNLDEIKNELDKKQDQLNDLLNQKKSLRGSILTYEKYLELFENISVKLRQTDDMAVIDQILRKFFSNFSVKQSGKGKEQRCSITHKLNEPWSGFVKYKNVACGRLIATVNEPIAKTVYTRFYATMNTLSIS